MMRVYDIPVVIADLRKVNNNGDDTIYDDAQVGIELRDNGVLQFDFRNLRPIRINDREGLIVEFDVTEVLAAIAEQIRDKAKS